MAYTKQVFQKGDILTANHMNHIEEGIEAAHTALISKVEAETGKGLSTNDYTDADKAKLAEIGDASNEAAGLVKVGMAQYITPAQMYSSATGETTEISANEQIAEMVAKGTLLEVLPVNGVLYAKIKPMASGMIQGAMTNSQMATLESTRTLLENNYATKLHPSFTGLVTISTAGSVMGDNVVIGARSGTGETYGMHSLSMGIGSRALGSSTIANGANAIAAGDYSIATGQYVNAYGLRSSANGLYTVAYDDHCHVTGKYNSIVQRGLIDKVAAWAKSTNYNPFDLVYVEDENNVKTYYMCRNGHRSSSSFSTTYWIEIPADVIAVAENKTPYLEIVGNGTGYTEALRSNARTLDADGNEMLSGNLLVKGYATIADFMKIGSYLRIGNTTINESQLQALLALIST